MVLYRFAARCAAPLWAANLLLAGGNGLPKPKSPPPSYYAEPARAATKTVDTPENRPARRHFRKLPVIVGIAAAGALAGALVAIHDDKKTSAGAASLAATPGTPTISGPK